MKWVLAKAVIYTATLTCMAVALALFTLAWFMDWCWRTVSRKR
jgi:hypothetical protein